MHEKDGLIGELWQLRLVIRYTVDAGEMGELFRLQEIGDHGPGGGTKRRQGPDWLG